MGASRLAATRERVFCPLKDLEGYTDLRREHRNIYRAAKKNTNLSNLVMRSHLVACGAQGGRRDQNVTRCFKAFAIIAISMSLPGFLRQKSYSTAT